MESQDHSCQRNIYSRQIEKGEDRMEQIEKGEDRMEHGDIWK